MISKMALHVEINASMNTRLGNTCSAKYDNSSQFVHKKLIGSVETIRPNMA